jgi:hypothetical protein
MLVYDYFSFHLHQDNQEVLLGWGQDLPNWQNSELFVESE